MVIMKALVAPTETLLTDAEVARMKVKTRGLNKLFKNPRIALPELEPIITSLLKSIHLLLLSADIPYTVESRRLVEQGFESLKNMEDVLIRVVLCGDDPKTAIQRNNRKR